MAFLVEVVVPEALPVRRFLSTLSVEHVSPLLLVADTIGTLAVTALLVGATAMHRKVIR